ncbi:MAG: Mur ligase family protein [Bacteroidota bacterium]|nr:Mur ligase family protein [Bacteroidota bacterium]
MRIHLIAIGGSIMHNLAIALHKSSHQVTGSDDQIYEPALSRLGKYELLPKVNGWNPDLLDSDIDLVILGMHAKAENPELAKAQKLGLRILSFPELIYELTVNKKRVVIAGSHGKTSITAMILHVLAKAKVSCDYAVGSSLAGFEDSVYFNEANEIAIIEGDEYLSSALTPIPKFMYFKPHILVINGVAWDHYNVFPTYENYLSQFTLLLDSVNQDCKIVYPQSDNDVNTLVQAYSKLYTVAAEVPKYELRNGKFHLLDYNIQLQIVGYHNLANASVSAQVCAYLGVDEKSFYNYLADFTGAGKRLERLIVPNSERIVFKDFAHSPSKVKATVAGVKSQYPGLEIEVILELHTYSSLSAAFLPEYSGSLSGIIAPVILIDNDALTQKGREAIAENEIMLAFKKDDVKFIQTKTDLIKAIMQTDSNKVLLIMSSGSLMNVPILDHLVS